MYCLSLASLLFLSFNLHGRYKNPQNRRNNLIFKTARCDINRRVSINHGALWAKKGREKERVNPSPVGFEHDVEMGRKEEDGRGGEDGQGDEESKLK